MYMYNNNDTTSLRRNYRKQQQSVAIGTEIERSV